jgi:nitrate/nitrite transport system substrate-binding protein
MKRWGYVEGDIDYKGIAEQVYLAADTAKVMKDLGYTPPSATYKKHIIMGKEFDYNKPEEYIASFPIKKA